MYKRILRSISAILILAMLAEMFPTTLLGNFVQRTAAAETPKTAVPYTYDTPQETASGIHAEVPPTFIDEVSTAFETEVSLETSALALPEALEQTEDDSRFLALLQDTVQFSALSEEDAVFLCQYTGISASDFAILEASGISLPQSINYENLANEFGCSVAEIIDLGPSDEMYYTLLIQIAIYKATIRDDILNTDLDRELRGYLLQGNTCEQVYNAYGISQTFGLKPNKLLTEDEDAVMPSGLSEADAEQIQEFSGEFGVQAAPLAAYALNNGLTAKDMEAFKEEIEETSASLMAASVQSTDGNTPEADIADYPNPYLGAPYTYNSSENEEVALNSGALIYENTDYILPGVKGLDLVIGRRYNSQDAGVYMPTYRETTLRRTSYIVTYGCVAWWDVPGLGQVTDNHNTVSITVAFSNRSDAETFLASCRTGSSSTKDSDGVTHTVVYYASMQSATSVTVRYSSDIKDNVYLNELYGLGQGWSFQFSSIESNEDQKYLRLSSGSIYEIDWNSRSHLKDYSLTAMVLEKNCREFSNGSVSSQYRLTYQDGRREYFSGDGRLIGIQDRYDNTITLVHSTQNGYPCITITDTLNRVTVISGQDSADGHTMTVSLPDGVTLTYLVEHQQSDGSVQALAAYTDPTGSTTHYSYTLQDAGFHITTKRTDGATNQYLNLTTITHPTGAQSVYTYALAERNLGSQGLMQVYRVASRADKVGTAMYGQLTYIYSSNDYSGYPAYQDPEKLPDSFTYSTAVINAENVSTTVTFNSKHLQTKVEVQNGSHALQSAEYTYNDNQLPIQMKTSSYSEGNQTLPLVSITALDYDVKGNVTAEWSPLADGDTANTEYRTTYTYDSTYNLLLTKTYKTDANTTVKLVNTLDDSKKSIVRTEVYVNNVLTSRTDYTYDSYGNVTSEKHYRDGFATYDLTEYSYQDHAYLSQEKHSGILTADGGNAVSTPGQAAGTIATSYTYDTLGRMTSSTDGSGNVTSYTYDALGNVTQITNPDNTTVSYARDYTKNTLTVTDENGARVKYTYTLLGLEYETVDVQTGKVITRKEYDSASRLIKVSDFVYGAVTAYAYDALGRVTSETIKQGTTILSKTLYAYDDAAENGQYQKVTKTVVGDENAPSIVTTQYTDKNGNVVKTGKFLNGTEYFDTAVYDYVGNVITQLTAADAAKNLPFTAKYEYNENGQVTKTYNAENQATTNTYNALGQLVQTTDYAGTPTAYTYDALGRLLTQTITIEDGITATSKYDYDASGNIIREYKPTNAVGSAEAWSKTEYVYDSRQNLTQVKQYNGNSIASQTSYTYDSVGNLLTMTAGGNTTSYTYDRFGNTLTMTDALGQQEIYTYSTLGKLVSKTDRNGIVTSYTYDALGRPVSTVAGSDVIQYAYTQTGQVQTEQTNNQRTIYTYDELGQVIQITETEQNILSDPSVPDPDPEPDPEPEPTPEPGTVFIVTLNANGGTVSPTTVQVVFGGVYDLPTPTHDSLAFSGWYLARTRIVNGASVQITEDCTFTAQWRPKQNNPQQPVKPTPPPNIPIFPPRGEQQLIGNEVDADDASIPESDAGPTDELISYVKTYAYDLAGNRTGFTLVKSGETVQNVAYTYDTLNRLSTVTENGSPQTTYTYDINGNRASLTYANGTQETYTYNQANWITSLENKKGSETLSSFTYTYYVSGSQKSETDYTGKTTSYVYDGLGRLTREAESNGLTVSYTYDSAGNRSKMAVTGTETYTTVYAYDANNRLLTEAKTENGETVTTSYAYDANGNTLSKSTPAHGEKAASSTLYAYNGFNQLVGLTIDGTTIAYAYNAQGIRTAKRVNNLRTAFLLDGGNVAAEVQNNAITNNYLHGVNLIRREATNETEYYLFNAHGDVVTTTNLNGTINQEYDYDAFGNEKNPDSLDTNHFRYCGEYLDVETGSYYLRARYYEPTLGRFTQQDTHWNTANMIYGDNPQKINEREDKLGLKTYSYAPQIAAVIQSGNLYVYGLGNPIAYSDPNGNIGTPISWAMTVIAGVAGGLYGNYLADKYNLSGWKRAALVAATTTGGAIAGYLAGEFLVGFTTSFLLSNPAIMMQLPTTVLTLFGINGENIAVLGRFAEGVGYTNLAQHLGACFYSIPDAMWSTLSEAEQWSLNQQFLDNMIAQGKEFILSNNAFDTLINAPNSYFAKEIQHLLENGYIIVENGWKMVLK